MDEIVELEDCHVEIFKSVPDAGLCRPMKKNLTNIMSYINR